MPLAHRIEVYRKYDSRIKGYAVDSKFLTAFVPHFKHKQSLLEHHICSVP